MRSVTWEFLRPMFVGDEITLELVITRCRPGRGGTAGLVHRLLRLVNQDDVVVHTGTSSVVMERRGGVAVDDHAVGRDFAAADWARALAARLADDERFASAAASFDGAIGFQVGEERAYLRIVHGQIVESGRQSDAARRFAVVGSEIEWVDFALATRNDFIARATAGRFSVRGDVYEYLRLTKALHVCFDHIQAMAAEATGHHGS
jgi:hypothetical protein